MCLHVKRVHVWPYTCMQLEYMFHSKNLTVATVTIPKVAINLQNRFFKKEAFREGGEQV